MTSKEPMNLSEWGPPTAVRQGGRLFTCGRPGRATFGRDKRPVDDGTIDLWVKGLFEARPLHIISLLGQKTNGFSEFDYYPFRSSKESGTKPTFQEWLHQHYGRCFVVHEFPTVDRRGIPPDILKAVARRVLDLIENGSTVVVVDSAGAERTARVCEAIGYKRIRQGEVTRPSNRLQPTGRLTSRPCG
jgi:hypothetical protein